MKKSLVSHEYNHISGVLAEMYEERESEELSTHQRSPHFNTVMRSKPGRNSAHSLQLGNLSIHHNPLDECFISYDPTSGRLTFLISIAKPMRIVSELYGTNGKFIKRLFDRQFEVGMTEINNLSSGLKKGTNVILLNSNEGMKYFRILVE